MATSEIIVVDSRPASPEMAAALVAVEAAARASASRAAAINTDPRVIRLRAMKDRPVYEEGMIGARQLFADMASGATARQARIAALVRARIGQIDHNPVAIRNNLRNAARIRREHWTRCDPLTAAGVSEAVNLREVA